MGRERGVASAVIAEEDDLIVAKDEAVVEGSFGGERAEGLLLGQLAGGESAAAVGEVGFEDQRGEDEGEEGVAQGGAFAEAAGGFGQLGRRVRTGPGSGRRSVAGVPWGGWGCRRFPRGRR